MMTVALHIGFIAPFLILNIQLDTVSFSQVVFQLCSNDAC
jgi:hypothetical protein